MSLSPTGTVDPGEAGRLFREGNLAAALAAANAAVRRAPTDIGARVLLAELLSFSGNIERADVVLDACADLDPTAAIVVAEFRQLLRGELARRQLFSEGRVPEFLGEPTAAQRSSLAAIVALRNGDPTEAARLAAAAEEARPHPAGTAGSTAFNDMRDADDLLASCFEVITTTGKYFWIPPERVLLLEFHAAKRPRDLFWRRATMQVADGPDGDVYLPAIYPPTTAAANAAMTDALRLGRATDWQQAGDGGPTLGLGAVTILVGEEALTWLEMDKISFQVAS
jgi:type VI secretion system protein ImpE